MRRTILLLFLLTCPIAHAEPLLEEYYRSVESTGKTDKETIAGFLDRATIQGTFSDDSADSLLTSGVIRAAYAKTLGIGGLAELKRARDELERSISREPSWRGGYAKAFLARLYATVPPWPISFGNDKRAAKLLSEVLTLVPDSLAGNLYEGIRRASNREESIATTHLKLAFQGTLDCECPIWQSTLRDQAIEAMNELAQGAK
ncbi:MAG: hypothetical protein R3E82_12860 [Pseudomonadales bacterium]